MASVLKLEEFVDLGLFEGSSCAFGVFDGLHRGHRFLLDETIKTAAEHDTLSCVLTFDIDPDEIFHPERLKKLMSNDERLAALAESGVDAVLVLPFTRELASLEPYSFLESCFGKEAPAFLHVGSNFHFGFRAQGGVSELCAWGASRGMQVHAHDLKLSDGSPITATSIRLLLQEGRIEEANGLLGHPYVLSGLVKRGRGCGGSFGFQTANLETDSQYNVLHEGVYAARAYIGKSTWRAAVNIGVAPTFQEVATANCEAHILDFEGNLYDQTIRLEFLNWLREARTFESQDELIPVVMNDIAWVDQHVRVEDADFGMEQKHLSETYAKLEDIRDGLSEQLSELLADAGDSIRLLRDELFLGRADADQILEMQVEYEHLNQLIDQHNLSHDVAAERLSRALLLLKRPYFAKVVLRYQEGQAPKELYIGAASMMGDDSRQFILDWRSPVAEVYYNQENGHTSYEANGRTIPCELLLRRQFDIYEDRLNSYFDTTVAIEDSLLLESLAQRRSDKMQAITTTIQREQNTVIRHLDIPVLLVNGIAGSGKTSVLLQRIAYLFYTYRDTLDPAQVCLITPNPVFRTYIDAVLPEMGESNSRLITYKELIAQVGRLDRGSDTGVDISSLKELGRRAEKVSLGADDFREIKVGDETVISLAQIRAAHAKYAGMPSLHGMIALIAEHLERQLLGRVKSRSHLDKVHDEVLFLPEEEQRRIFGQRVFPQTEEDLEQLSQRYLTDRYQEAFRELARAEWLRIDRIGHHLQGGEGLSRVEWAYLRLCLTGMADTQTRFVMIDEVQDYTAAQLLFLGAYFPRAHFLLLGDENQAIYEGTASFDEVKDVFSEACGQVEECRLMTSYRSSQEITELFSALMDEKSAIEVRSVRASGRKPRLVACADDAEYKKELKRAVAKAKLAGSLLAVIAANDYQAKCAQRDLAALNIPSVKMDVETKIPPSGVAIFTVRLAKGLEFDHVLLPDANPSNYPATPLARRRLYTAVSRATENLTILARGNLSPLLQD